MRHVGIATARPQKWRGRWTEQVGAGQNQLAGTTGPGCPMDVASSCVFVQVCVWTGWSNLKVRSPSHGGRFQRVRNTLGLWAAESEQGGDSISYTGAQV